MQPTRASPSSQLNAVEVTTGQLRPYKTLRIEAVELLAAPASHAAVQEQLDVFGLAGPEWLTVKMAFSA